MEIKDHLITESDTKLFENLVDSPEVMVNHAVLPAGSGFDAHPTDSNVIIQIRRGELTLTFADGTSQHFGSGQLVEIPYMTLAKIDNHATSPLDLIVTKAPNPKSIARG